MLSQHCCHPNNAGVSLFCAPPLQISTLKCVFRLSISLNLWREALKRVLNLPLSPVSFNQSTQQVEPFLKKEEELWAVLPVTAKAHRSSKAIFITTVCKKGVLSLLTNCCCQGASLVLPLISFTISKSQLMFPKKTWCFGHVPPAVFPEQRQIWPFLWLPSVFFLPLPPWERTPVFIKPGTMTVLHSLIPHLPITHYFPEQQAPTKLSHSSVFHVNRSEFDFLLKDQASKKLLTLAGFLFPSFYRSLSSCCFLFTGFLQSSVHNFN